MFFTNTRELSAYIQHLEKIIKYMVDDFYVLSTILNLYETKNSILDTYSRVADGPTILEQILIKEGSIEANEVLFNIFSEELKQSVENLKELANKI